MSKMEVDITPSPKVLSVLGEIEFKPIQCIAELIDNSIDGFLNSERAGTAITNPTVLVAFGRNTVVVKDNGPGMSIEILEKAVKAGWSSNDKFGNLGLYGIGFNIATARLGFVTTIWTTQIGDTVWHGLEIDLQKLARGETYKLSVHTRTKSYLTDSGTEIEVSQLKLDWKDLFANSNWIRTNITERLASTYGTMLRETNPEPIKFALQVNGKRVSAWEHCVWPADWTVFRKNEGLVRPIQEIDMTFGKKYLSRSTGDIYDSRENLEDEDIVEIPERIYGWLGIQRYADEKEYGVDILRNGRKIETWSKDIFDWEDSNSEVLHEYVIDDPRQRGRIVGEIHLDHGYVHYTKHRFEREHASWKQLMQAVRHNEPLTKRDVHGFTGVNESPLGILFRVFRRNSPQSGSPQTYKDILFIKDNDKAKSMAREYRKGIVQYRNDEIWREELEKSNTSSSTSTDSGTKKTTKGTRSEENATGASNNSDTEKQDSNPILDFGYAGNDTNSQADQTDQSDPTTASSEKDASNDQDTPDEPSNPNLNEDKTIRSPLPGLSFHIAGIGISGKSYDVEVYESDPLNTMKAKHAWFARLTERNVYEIDVNLGHPAFNSTSLQIRDAVLAQVAYLITYEENASAGMQKSVNYGDILVALRTRYATNDSLDANHLRMEIDGLGKRIAQHLSKTYSMDEQRKMIMELLPEDVKRIELAYARGPRNLPLVSYLDIKHIERLLEHQPEELFNSGCFNKDWTPDTLALSIILLTEHREHLKRELSMLMTEMADFMNNSPSSAELTKSYLALVRACVNRLKEYLVDDNIHA